MATGENQGLGNLDANGQTEDRHGELGTGKTSVAPAIGCRWGQAKLKGGWTEGDLHSAAK